MRTQVSIRLDSELLAAVRDKAAEADRSLAYVTEMALRGWLKRQTEGSAQMPSGVVQKAVRKRGGSGPHSGNTGPSLSDEQGGGSISIPASALGPVEPRLVDRPRHEQVDPDWKAKPAR